MDIQHKATMPAGLVEATCTGAEPMSNEFGDSLLLFFDVKGPGGEILENMRIYCTPVISRQSKLGRLLECLGVDSAKLKSDAAINKAVIGKVAPLVVSENEAGYMRLNVPRRD